VITNLKDLPESVAVWGVAGETSDGILLVDVADCEALGDLRVRLEHMPGLVSVTTVPILKTILEKRIGSHLCC
jgi:DNA-binding Lrp family transcriptional regulator